jgi:uncharacterized membrane protein YqhA
MAGFRHGSADNGERVTHDPGCVRFVAATRFLMAPLYLGVVVALILLW